MDGIERKTRMSETEEKEVSIGDAGQKFQASDRMALNVGPSHRLLGVLRLMMELNGDLIEKCEPVLGYLIEGTKDLENMTSDQFIPYTDRLDYLAPLANNVAYAITVENLASVKVRGCEAVRVLVCEMARISSHLLGMGVFGMDAGAWTCIPLRTGEIIHLIRRTYRG